MDVVDFHRTVPSECVEALITAALSHNAAWDLSYSSVVGSDNKSHIGMYDIPPDQRKKLKEYVDGFLDGWKSRKVD